MAPTVNVRYRASEDLKLPFRIRPRMRRKFDSRFDRTGIMSHRHLGGSWSFR